MKLATREDIEAPIAFVWQSLGDFEHWERTAMRQGAEVTRTDRLVKAAPGMAWTVKFPWRGKPRKLDIRLTTLTPRNAMAFDAEGSTVEGSLALDLVEMGPNRTRVSITMDVRARTLAARLFLQSLRLARGRIERQFKARTSTFATSIGQRYGRPARF